MNGVCYEMETNFLKSNEMTAYHWGFSVLSVNYALKFFFFFSFTRNAQSNFLSAFDEISLAYVIVCSPQYAHSGVCLLLPIRYRRFKYDERFRTNIYGCMRDRGESKDLRLPHLKCCVKVPSLCEPPQIFSSWMKRLSLCNNFCVSTNHGKPDIYTSLDVYCASLDQHLW